jgi:hypothetical protein
MKRTLVTGAILAVLAGLAGAAEPQGAKQAALSDVFQKPVDWAAATNRGKPVVVSERGAAQGGPVRDDLLKCANWIYAGSKSSVCFSPKFLETVRTNTTLEADGQFTPVRLADRQVFDFPFAVMTGEGTFTLQEAERQNLKEFLLRGGFLLASSGCSCNEWAQAFRREIVRIFPDTPLKSIPMTHPMFHTVYDIAAIKLKHGGTALLQGLEVDGRIVMVYTSEGLNDTGNVKGCCCCGGNEIKNSQEINVNIFAYAAMH